MVGTLHQGAQTTNLYKLQAALAPKSKGNDLGFFMYRMYGMSQGAKDGGVTISTDGWYVTKSHGWRCDDVQGWMVYRKEPRTTDF